MQANNILQADMLDILFEHKNKDYGAYQLRKNYNKRLLMALALTLLAACFIFLGSLLAGSGKKPKIMIMGPDVVLDKVKEPEPKKIEPPKPLELPKPAEQIKTIKVTPPAILPDDRVKPEDEMKTVDEMDKMKIGLIDNPNGKDDPNGVTPPVMKEQGTGLAQEIKPKEDIDAIFHTVQIEARFPGGLDAWRKFLERNLNRDLPAENGAPEGMELRVVVSFVVSREEGKVSEVKAENDPGYGAAAEAVRVIQRGPNWIPAVQNGRNVNYRQKQTIIFKITE